MKDLLKTGYCRLRQLRINRRERNYVYKVMRTNGIPDKPCAEETAWLRKWRPLYASVSPVYLRCFRAYLTENRERIVPGEICANLVEPLLNPARYRFYYEDKNVYDRLFGPEAMPRTYLRRMEGQFYDAAYRPCDFPAPERLRELTQNAERIIVKPTVDTESGRDIVLYRLDPADGTYKDQKGEPLTAANRRRWQNAVGYVSQHVFLLDGTLLENIALGEEEEKIDRRRAEESLRAARLEDFVQSLSAGIDTPIGEAGNKLSGGQRQRIGIARALYKQANILFFDEATSALDSGTEEGINRSIAELSQHNRDLTIVVIAHRESSLEYCDRIITLDNNG